MPPEKSAYALARYSRSPDSIRQSLEWVRTHDEKAFLESYYFQYGHASIADLGHTIFCFEGVSELAAIEIEDEPLWDGQAKSSRYQDFSQSAPVTPPELRDTPGAAGYQDAAAGLLQAYHNLHRAAFERIAEANPRPESMKPEAYRRNINARAFDVARYLLPLGIPTNLGQVVSIRTLEKQIRRLAASCYAEVREIAAEMREACAAPPSCAWDSAGVAEPLAPTLARHADPDWFAQKSRANVAAWAAANLAARPVAQQPASVDLVCPTDPVDETVATLLYGATHQPFRVLYDEVSAWSAARKREVMDVALEGRPGRDELLREFRSGYALAFDVVTDIGAYRDLHRHRRCIQVRQPYTTELGYETPALLSTAGLDGLYRSAMHTALAAAATTPYLLPFATRLRCLFKMDFAEAEYIARVRSGVKGHFSYRHIAWLMKEKLAEAFPDLGRLVAATPPEVEDPLRR
jgi:thymidylate synthase ThyX